MPRVSRKAQKTNSVRLPLKGENMGGRAVIQIPTKDIVCIESNEKKGITEITLEGDQYPNWYAGQDPMVIIGASQLSSTEFITVEKRRKHDRPRSIRALGEGT